MGFIVLIDYCFAKQLRLKTLNAFSIIIKFPIFHFNFSLMNKLIRHIRKMEFQKSANESYVKPLVK